MASSSTWPAESMQFRDRGRERVTRRTCGAGNESLAKEVGGGGLVKAGVVMVETRNKSYTEMIRRRMEETTQRRLNELRTLRAQQLYAGLESDGRFAGKPRHWKSGVDPLFLQRLSTLENSFA